MSDVDSLETPPVVACAACGENSIDESYERFDAVCENCGYVIHDSANPITVREQSIGTQSDGTEQPQLSWLKYCPIRNATENRLVHGIDALESICDKLEIDGKVRLRGAELFGDAIREKLTDGRDGKIVVAAALYCAAKEQGVPVPSNLLAQSADIASGNLYQLVRVFEDSLELHLATLEPADYLPYLGSALGLDDQRVCDAEKLIDGVGSHYTMSGKNPVGIGAAALYTVLDGQRTQHEISEAAGISTETLRVRVAEFRKMRERE